MAGIANRIQNARGTENSVEGTAYDAHLAAKFLSKTIGGFFVANNLRIEQPSVSQIDDLERVQEIVNVRGEERCIQLPAYGVNGAVAADYRFEFGFLSLEPCFQLPIETFGLRRLRTTFLFDVPSIADNVANSRVNKVPNEFLNHVRLVHGIRVGKNGDVTLRVRNGKVQTSSFPQALILPDQANATPGIFASDFVGRIAGAVGDDQHLKKASGI